GAPRDARTDPAAFAAFARDHPIGLRRRRREHVRLVLGADFDRRALRVAAELPQGGLAWLMDADGAAVAAAGRGACADAVAALGGADPLALLAFGACARRGVAGEPEALRACAAGAPVAGFYGLGEIARARGVTAFHNQALAVLAVA
ncbi:MAG TPA: FIST C-terminal domain-containing protein, partial [Capillimicrobium sp.]